MSAPEAIRGAGAPPRLLTPELRPWHLPWRLLHPAYRGHLERAFYKLAKTSTGSAAVTAPGKAAATDASLSIPLAAVPSLLAALNVAVLDVNLLVAYRELSCNETNGTTNSPSEQPMDNAEMSHSGGVSLNTTGDIMPSGSNDNHKGPDVAHAGGTINSGIHHSPSSSAVAAHIPTLEDALTVLTTATVSLDQFGALYDKLVAVQESESVLQYLELFSLLDIDATNSVSITDLMFVLCGGYDAEVKGMQKEQEGPQHQGGAAFGGFTGDKNGTTSTHSAGGTTDITTTSGYSGMPANGSVFPRAPITPEDFRYLLYKKRLLHLTHLNCYQFVGMLLEVPSDTRIVQQLCFSGTPQAAASVK